MLKVYHLPKHQAIPLNKDVIPREAPRLTRDLLFAFALRFLIPEY